MPYTKPTPAHLAMRYPAFAAVDEAVRQYWLTDAERFVDESWREADYAPALMARAAHSMVRASVTGIAGGAVDGLAASGVTSFKSGTFSASFSESAASLSAAGGLGSSEYGRDYLEMLYRNKGGGGVTAPGVVVGCGFRTSLLGGRC